MDWNWWQIDPSHFRPTFRTTFSANWIIEDGDVVRFRPRPEATHVDLLISLDILRRHAVTGGTIWMPEGESTRYPPFVAVSINGALVEVEPLGWQRFGQPYDVDAELTRLRERLARPGFPDMLEAAGYDWDAADAVLDRLG